MAEGLGLDGLEGPFRPEGFYAKMIPQANNWLCSLCRQRDFSFCQKVSLPLSINKYLEELGCSLPVTLWVFGVTMGQEMSILMPNPSFELGENTTVFICS